MLRRELLEQAGGRQKIDWGRIGRAVSFYISKGYKYVELPWTVSPEATQVTYGGEVLTTQAGDFLGSAEQAFIEYNMLSRSKWSPSTKLVAVSPCFRIEPKYDSLHHMSFMKVELYSKSVTYEEMCYDAIEFFNQEGITDLSIEDQPPGDYVVQVDLVNSKGIELGSYGYREHGSMKWSYGTGLAEPRMSVVLK